MSRSRSKRMARLSRYNERQAKMIQLLGKEPASKITDMIANICEETDCLGREELIDVCCRNIAAGRSVEEVVILLERIGHAGRTGDRYRAVLILAKESP